MTSNEAPKQASQRVSAILEGAARVFAMQGNQASMDDVADAAGVARATVYRYFPNREVLLHELTQTSVGDVSARLLSARICDVAPKEGVTRTVRALVEVGDSFVLLARERQRSAARFERELTQPVRELFEFGQANGHIRGDIATAHLIESLIGLIVSLLSSTPRLGKEDLTATITGLFLDGARARDPRLPPE